MSTYTRVVIEKAAHAVEARPSEFTAVQIKKYLDDLATDERKPLGETIDQAFARVATRNEIGKKLFRALRKRQAETGEADHDPADEEPTAPERGEAPPETPALRQLYDLADDHRKQNPNKTRAQSFAAIMQTPRGAALYRQHKAELAQQ
ncbi:MAG TPA: hypothetical protein VGR52_01525 [Stellaceae bacterium]|nr:hypothetical protein [Stellaceae bacterium]